MIRKERLEISSHSEGSYWDAAVKLGKVHEAECPRLISLIEAISMPIIAGTFNFSAHLLEPLSHELLNGHVDLEQADLMYLRILEIHENNLKEIESLKDGVLDSTLDEFKESLIGSLFAHADRYLHESRKISGQRRTVDKQPLCMNILTNRAFGRQQL